MRLGGRSGVAKQRATEERGSEREEARRRTRRSAEAAKKKRGSRGEARKQQRRGESRKTEGRKTKDSIMNLDDDRVLFYISFDTQITNPISSISLVFLLVLAHPGGRREGQRRASIVSQ